MFGMNDPRVVSKWFCGNIECTNEIFYVEIVKKQYIIAKCISCKKAMKIHRSHLDGVLNKGTKKQIRDYYYYELE